MKFCKLLGLSYLIWGCCLLLVGQQNKLATKSVNLKNSEFVKIPAGWFTMGHDQRAPDQKPSHRVYLEAFEIGRFEVTNQEYYQFWQANKSHTPQDFPHNIGNWPERALEYPNQPVVGVSWVDAESFANWVGGRLPTEAEWEKAAAGPVDRLWPWGNNPTTKGPIFALANSWNGNDQYDNGLAPVGSYPQGKSYYGALDMAGNVWEWTSDWYSEIYYTYSPTHNPTGPKKGSWRVIRGGGWIDNINRCTTTMRLHLYPKLKLSFVGFRVLRPLSPNSTTETEK